MCSNSTYVHTSVVSSILGLMVKLYMRGRDCVPSITLPFSMLSSWEKLLPLLLVSLEMLASIFSLQKDLGLEGTTCFCRFSNGLNVVFIVLISSKFISFAWTPCSSSSTNALSLWSVVLVTTSSAVKIQVYQYTLIIQSVNTLCI